MNGRCFLLLLCGLAPLSLAQNVTPKLAPGIANFGQVENGSWNAGLWNSYVPIQIDLSQFTGDLVSVTCSAGTVNPSAVNPAPASWATGFWVSSPPQGVKITCTLVDHDTGAQVTFTITILTDGTVASTSGLNVNDPISTATGELYSTPPPDLSLGGPLPLVFQRYYATLINADGLNSRIGNNWTHNFEWVLKITGSFVQVISPENKVVTFQPSGNGYQLVVGEKYPYQLIAGQNNTYQFLDPGTNLIYTFAGTGTTLGLSTIRDRNGNTHTITQPSAGVFQIADGLGRTLTLSFDPTTNNVSKVTDQTGRSVSYAYTGGNLTQVTDANGKNELYAYSTAGAFGGLMTGATMPLGNKPFSQTFDSLGRVASQTDSLGHTTNLSFDATGGTALIVNAAGVTTRQTSRGFTDFTSFIDADNQTVGAGYDSSARRNQVTDRLGDKTSRTYDVSGQIATETNAAGNLISYTWTSQTQNGFTFYVRSKVTTADGSVTSFTYDNNGNLLTSTDSSGKVTKFTYNTHGQETSATDPAGHVTSAAYNADGTVASTTDAAGNVTTYFYDALKRVNQIKYADGSTRSATHDNRDNVLKATDERGKTATAAYNDNNNISTITDALGKSTTVAYDTNDNIIKITDRAGNSRGFTYNALGLEQSQTSAAGVTTTYNYDTHNRLGSMVDSTGKGLSFAYDKEDVLASVTDALAHKTAFTTDKLGYLVQTTSPLGENSVIARNTREGVTASTDAAGVRIANGFDSVNRLSTTSVGGLPAGISRDASGLLTGIMDPNGNLWNLNRDSAGRVGARVDPLNRATAYTYDARNRVSTAQTPLGSVTYTYDPAGNLTNRKYSDGTNFSYTYDDDDRLLTANGVTLAYDANGNITNSNGLAITRDKDGRIASITYAAGKTVNYVYNSQGLLTSIQDWVNGTTSFVYDAALELTSITRANKLVTKYSYDNDGRLASIQEDANSLAIAIGRDPAGKILSETTSGGAAPSLPPNGSQPFTFDAASQVSAFTYDGMGRVISDNLHQYTWNLASQLTARSGSDGSASASYDAFGLRTSTTSGGSTTNSVWNYATTLPSLAIAKNGSADVEYLIYTPDGILLYGVNASTNARTFFHFDAHGSTTMLSNDAGAVTDTYSITPYGESVTQNGSTPNPFTWMGAFGAMQDGSSGVYYIRARYYDSTSARFLSPDSVVSTNPLQVNPYQFAWNNPISFTDATGAGPTITDAEYAKYAESFSKIFDPEPQIGGFGGWGSTPRFDVPDGFRTINPGQTAFTDPVASASVPPLQDFGGSRFSDSGRGSGRLPRFNSVSSSPCGLSMLSVFTPRSYRTGGSIQDPTTTTYTVPNPFRSIQRAFIQFAGFTEGRSSRTPSNRTQRNFLP